jgi:hypothetical protein
MALNFDKNRWDFSVKQSAAVHLRILHLRSQMLSRGREPASINDANFCLNAFGAASPEAQYRKMSRFDYFSNIFFLPMQL